MAGADAQCGVAAIPVTLAGVDDPMPVTRDLRIPLSELTVRVTRSSGPGGQHANVTESRVEVVFDVAGSPTLTDTQRTRLLARHGPRITAIAQDARSQTRNRELALERLRDRIASGLAVRRPRTPTKPSRAARARRVDAKKRKGETKRARRRPDAD
jgi:ribosome-associated protein